MNKDPNFWIKTGCAIFIWFVLLVIVFIFVYSMIIAYNIR